MYLKQIAETRDSKVEGFGASQVESLISLIVSYSDG